SSRPSNVTPIRLQEFNAFQVRPDHFCGGQPTQSAPDFGDERRERDRCPRTPWKKGQFRCFGVKAKVNGPCRGPLDSKRAYAVPLQTAPVGGSLLAGIQNGNSRSVQWTGHSWDSIDERTPWAGAVARAARSKWGVALESLSGEPHRPQKSKAGGLSKPHFG